MKKTLLFILMLVLVAGCSEESTIKDPPPPFEPTPPVNPQDKGERLFGVTVSESVNGFQEDFPVAQEAGIQVAELALAWNTVETEEGVYSDPDGILAATAFYAAENVSVMLVFRVIDTVAHTVPDYLGDPDWDSRTLSNAFNSMVNWVLAELPDEVVIAGVAIGNEVDLYLGDDDWAAYGEFFFAAVTNIHQEIPGTKVGVKTTVSQGLFGTNANNIIALNEEADVVMLNYYLQDGQFQVRAPILVHNHFTSIANTFSGREVWLTEVGYQSGSEFCLSSEDQQAVKNSW